ncbi:MAG TPA: 2-hydroxymuconic semialdehyde dehydrogenase [Alphaproteobacteria bacterium]|nr:2-hydroxymuconic semialdehyde dehydrogenase [Alphaproteobacteria bacterium]
MQPRPYPYTGRKIPCYIDGAFVDSGEVFEKFSPVDGSLLALVAEADRPLIDRAVAAARAALRGAWGHFTLAERQDLLRRVAVGIEARFDDFVAAEVADTGKPLSHALKVDIPRGAANFRVFADLMTARGSESFHTDTPDGRGALNYVVDKPLGVVAVVSPWNLPLLLLSWKVAPALACGNTVIAKPSEETPATATLLAEIMHEVGLPPGVFNLVHGFGPGSAGEYLVSHADIDAITFTGETSTGSAIMKNAAVGLKPVSFELGGKNAAVIFADADFEAAVAGTLRSVFSNCGQVCLCTERVYVERPIFERFVGALADGARLMKIGDPYDGADMGPLISQKHREKVLGYYALARREGGRFIIGGGVPEFGDTRDRGAFIDPTIIIGLHEEARCVKEEIFGPVCHIAPFDSEAEAIDLANATRYGLAAAVWTSDLARGHRVARAVDAGVVWVNEWFLRDLRTPFGGIRMSGIGREGGQHSLTFYSETTNICVKY